MSAQFQAADNMSTTEAVSGEELKKSSTFLEHVKQYPLVNSTKAAVYSIPYTKEVIDAVSPTLKSIRDTQPIKIAVDTGDAIADNALNQVDKLVPGLKTLEIGHLTSPITRPINGAIEGVQATVNGTISTVNGTVNKTLVDPVTKAAGDIKEKIHTTIYDDVNGKSLITSQADPLVGPFNESLEKFIHNHFPKTKMVSKEGQSSELSRTVQIVSNVIVGAKEGE
ncbi:hypothetical protein DFJ63DRAFT_221638 [Scheffersomyces coipomensis]|uniref:uncharacterized protein n=1 Tax=Scheffersomyces coipomensis TaxID=1788519 RepID=UPI00315C85CE